MIVRVPTDSRRVLIDEYPLVIEVYFTQKGLLNYSPIGEECVRGREIKIKGTRDAQNNMGNQQATEGGSAADPALFGFEEDASGSPIPRTRFVGSDDDAAGAQGEAAAGGEKGAGLGLPAAVVAEQFRGGPRR